MAPETSSSPPVFVYGALRSGTTVFRLMLNAHPRLYSPGETDFLFDHLQEGRPGSGAWSYDREALAADRIFRAKRIGLPENLDGLDLLRHMIAEMGSRSDGLLTMNVHRHARLISATLPEARILHLLRDPRDVARSAIGMGWAGNSYYGVNCWLDAEESWDEAGFPVDQVLTLWFEALMSDLEAELGRVCDFLGVPFTPTMLDYHRTSTYDPPDPKIAQAWKRKATQHEIALIESRVGPLMETRGYARNGPPYVPTGPERLSLAVGNRLRRWHFNIRRYGFTLFASTHAARVLGLRSVHQRLKLRQEKILLKNIK
jgi:hypothetical protein